MTDPKVLAADPSVAEQFAVMAKDMLDGKLATPTRAVLIQFYANEGVYAQTYGIGNPSVREMLSEVLRAQEVLSGVASSLNAQAAN